MGEQHNKISIGQENYGTNKQIEKRPIVVMGNASLIAIGSNAGRTRAVLDFAPIRDPILNGNNRLFGSISMSSPRLCLQCQDFKTFLTWPVGWPA